MKIDNDGGCRLELVVALAVVVGLVIYDYRNPSAVLPGLKHAINRKALLATVMPPAMIVGLLGMLVVLHPDDTRFGKRLAKVRLTKPVIWAAAAFGILACAVAAYTMLDIKAPPAQ